MDVQSVGAHGSRSQRTLDAPIRNHVEHVHSVSISSARMGHYLLKPPTSCAPFPPFRFYSGPGSSSAESITLVGSWENSSAAAKLFTDLTHSSASFPCQTCGFLSTRVGHSAAWRYVAQMAQRLYIYIAQDPNGKPAGSYRNRLLIAVGRSKRMLSAECEQQAD